MENKDYLSLFLPEELAEYFQVVSITKTDATITLHLEEENLSPVEYKNDKLTSKGFYPSVSIQDFPIRGKACILQVKRRRWLNETSGAVVSRDWNLVAKGTRMTGEFAECRPATFLKGTA